MVEIKPDSKQFKILQLSNAVFTPSGYGVQSALSLPYWNQHYDVRQIANFGIQGRMLTLNGLTIYPCLPGDDHGGRTAQMVINNWKPDVFVTLYDIWMGAYNRDDGRELQGIHPIWLPIVMCLDGNTEVIGNEKDLLGFDCNFSITKNSQVTATQIFEPKAKMYEICTEDDNRLVLTADHKVLTKRGWIQACKLNIGDMVISIQSKSYGNSMGISSWIDRWRRNNHDKLIQTNSTKQQIDVIPQTCNSQQFPGINAVSEENFERRFSRNQSSNTHEFEAERHMLSMENRGDDFALSDSSTSYALPANQEASSANSVKVHRTQTTTEPHLQCTQQHRGLERCCRNSETEYYAWKRITRKSRLSRTPNKVYDVSTLTHNFFANNILVHNCDHEPLPEATFACAKNAYRVISPTRYCYQEFARNGVETEYIPLAVNTDVYKPYPETRREDREHLNKTAVAFDVNNNKPIEEDSFLIIMVGANKDPYRKNYGGMFTALRHAVDQCQELGRDLRVYVHSWMKQARDIPHTAKVLRLHDLCKGTSDYSNLCGVSEQSLAKYIACSDLFLHLSTGGGFEVPLLEALSCGTPAVASDFVCMHELIDGNGWPVPVRSKYLSPLDAAQGLADEYAAADAIVDAYKHPEKRADYAKKSREFALRFDYRVVNEAWMQLFEEIRSSRAYTNLQERRL